MLTNALRLGTGLYKSSKLKVLAFAGLVRPLLLCGLVRLTRDGFLIPNLPKSDLGAWIPVLSIGTGVDAGVVPDEVAASCCRTEQLRNDEPDENQNTTSKLLPS